MIRLRPLEPPDAVTMASWSLDERFRAAAEWSPRLSVAEHEAFQSRLIAEPPAELVRLGVVHAGELVGYVDLHGVEPARRELGFVIGDSRHWGKGLGRQAAQAALDHGFTRMALSEIWAEAWATNTASIRILQGLGMTELAPGDQGEYQGAATHYRRFTLRR
ncbi:GNAT family N-acetyltransferase [Actinoplanes sp. Pm04-4]|uniref:GNAT family N-acetyltransferase n=1 Tax=Paractinoplanes pyxinae TaxID=2997416 RepID=A0ABT4B0U6_9ACTN|nr:GNAT family N-acetyltransferase [Actinoplanes pyxinae]MCY1140090.1 GNAT family N-acetyltransferase [Actinoplanes pyxinae]